MDLTPASSEDPGAFDLIQETIGPFGKWQLIVWILTTMTNLPSAWHQMLIIFLTAPVNYTCMNPKFSNDLEKCKHFNYSRSVFEETVVTEFDLGSSDSPLGNLTQFFLMLGYLLGSIVFGALADIYGRREPLIWSVILQLAFGVITAFMPSLWLIFVFRFLVGFATGGVSIISFVIFMEIVVDRHRALLSVLFQMTFHIGHMSLALIAYHVRHWRKIQLITSLFSVFFLSYYCLLPESPRWCLTTGRIKQGESILRAAMKINKRSTSGLKKKIEKFLQVELDTNNVVEAGPLDLVRTPIMRRKTICICLIWLVSGAVYLGLAKYSNHLKGDIFLNVVMTAVLGMIGLPINLLSMHLMGRRGTVRYWHLLSGIAIIVVAVQNVEPTVLVNIMLCIAVIGQSVAFCCVYLYSGELFPTIVRNAGLGVAQAASNIGSMVSPFIVYGDYEWFALLVFGCMAIVATSLTLFLPETKGKPLPDLIEEADQVR